MTVQFLEKSTTQKFGSIVVSPNNPPTGKVRVIIFLHGIGDIVRKATLKQLYERPGFGATSTYPYTLIKSVDYFNTILLFVQTAQDYRAGEIQFAIQYAIDNLNADPESIAVVGHSLGGFGMINFCKNAADLATVSNLFFLASGPAPVTDDVGLNIVRNKTSVWLVHAKNDATVPYLQSKKVMDSILKADPDYKFAKLSITKAGGHTGPAGIMFNSYGPGNLPFNCTSAEDFCNTGVGMYDYWLMCKRGAPVEIPEFPYTPAPVVEPIIEKPLFILEIYKDGTTKKIDIAG